MAVDAIKIWLDHEQLRVGRHRLEAWAQAKTETDNGEFVSGWIDSRQITEPPYEVFVEPTAFSAMLCPMAASQQWQTSTTGRFARKQLSAFNQEGTGGTFVQSQSRLAGDYWIHARNTSNRTLRYQQPLQVNQGIYLALYVEQIGTDVFEVARVGWADSGIEGKHIRFFSDGIAEVYIGGVMRRYSWLGERLNPQQTERRAISIFIVPARGREIIVWTDAGSSFSHVVDDVDMSDEDPEITPDTKYYVHIPGGNRSLTLQTAPIVYPAEGVLYTRELFFSEPPPADADPDEETTFEVYGDFTIDPEPELVDINGNPLVFDGDANSAYVALKIFSDGEGRTPFLYGVVAAVTETSERTPADDVEITDRVPSLSMRVPQGADGVEANFEIVRPEELHNPDSVDYVAGLDRIDNRPIKIEVGDHVLLDGYLQAPRVRESWHPDGRRLSCSARDGFAVLNAYLFRQPVAFDGSSLRDNIEYLLRLCGFEEFDICEFPGPEGEFVVPLDGWRSGGYRFAFRANAGDSAGSWLQSLLDTFFPNYVYGFRPSKSVPGLVEFFVKNDEIDGAESLAAPPVFLSTENAIEWLTEERDYSEMDASLLATQYTAQNLTRHWVPAEATEVRITGYDRAAEKILQAYAVDAQAEDPTTPAIDRPANWCGSKRIVGIFDNRLGTQSEVDAICIRKFSQLSLAREMIEFDSGLICDLETGVPLWRGDLFRLREYEPPDEDDDDDDVRPEPPEEKEPEGDLYRIVSLDIRTQLEDGERLTLGRSVRYVAERMGETTPWSGRADAASIAEILEQRLWRSWSNQNEGQMLSNQPLYSEPKG